MKLRKVHVRKQQKKQKALLDRLAKIKLTQAKKA